MGGLLLKGGRVICPASGRDELADVLVEGGVIKAIGRGLEAGGARVVDCEGLVVAPGLIDMHAHLREPGQEHKETIATALAAAAAGGFTAVCAMPNTEPPNDSAQVTAFVLERARAAGLGHVWPVGAITRGLKGELLAPMGELKRAGCVGVSDDGRAVADSGVLRRAMEYARGLGLVVICHSEDEGLSRGGVMHEGAVSTRLGLKGIPAEAEVVGVERDIALAGLTGARVHITHISCKGSVEAVARAKARGLKVTCDTCPHYLLLTHEDVEGYDTDRKMNPPLRTEADRQALVKALAEGVIDAVATDHAPHAPIEKEVEFELAPFGVVGLETAVGAVLTLVARGELTLNRAIEAMSRAPARILGVGGGELKEGAVADITVIDPDRPWVVEPERFRSKGRNSPFKGWQMPGRAVMTICRGRAVHEESR